VESIPSQKNLAEKLQLQVVEVTNNDPKIVTFLSNATTMVMVPPYNNFIDYRRMGGGMNCSHNIVMQTQTSISFCERNF
jgi:hypothetical protein